MNDIVDICEEVQQNFLDSSLETNMNRAFPNIKDGLKPGQRACLWEMYIKKYTSDKPHVKSAKVSGGVIADLWPHGDTAIYETFARMSQPFINNIPEVDWHGANGNVILGGDALAHQRYTECRLAPIVEEGMLYGVKKNTVPMILNFSEDMEWPLVLPAIFPRLLVNGAQGIGVSISNVWLPHNFTETANLILHYIKTGELDNENYFPDFPTGGIIINQNDLSEINKTGRGKVILESKYTINKQEINFYELPYQVYIEPIIEEIKEAIAANKITGIKDIFNKSDKKKISLVIECEVGQDPSFIVECLFNETNLRKQYNANQNGIISKVPIMITLKDYVDTYIQHNTFCIKNEFQYDFNTTNNRIEVLEGLCKALEDIDNVIKIIKESKSAALAKINLIEKYHFSTVQAEAILNMKLSRLANMEKLEVEKELEEKRQLALQCKEIIDSPNRQKQILIERLRELANKFGTERRTEVIQKEAAKNISAKKQEELPQDVVICLTKNGYFKNIPKTQYKTNIDNIFAISTTTLNMIYAFSNMGKVYRLLGKDIPVCGVRDKGAAAGSILQLQNNEKIIFVCDIDKIKNKYIMFITKNGKAKKTFLTDYIGATRNFKGAPALKMKEDDSLFTYLLLDEGDVLLTSKNYYICFNSEEISIQGKVAAGLQAMNLKDDDCIVKAEILIPNSKKEIVRQHRNGRGIKI